MTPNYMKTLDEAIRRLEANEINEVNEISPGQRRNTTNVRGIHALTGQNETHNSYTSFNSYSPQAKATAEVFATLERRCPDYVGLDRWQRAVEDGRRFLAQWGSQAAALGWTAEELFGLHEPPSKPHPSYDRLVRYDETGLLWLLNGLPVVMLTEVTAAIETKTGTVITYRKLNKPGLGPVGDSLDDFV
jgi:hypothetical protein